MQISFYGDYLESLSSSSEMTIPSLTSLYQEIEWKGKDIPRCFTPINEIEFLKNKRLTIVIWVTNENTSQEVVGQV